MPHPTLDFSFLGIQVENGAKPALYIQDDGLPFYDIRNDVDERIEKGIKAMRALVTEREKWAFAVEYLHGGLNYLWSEGPMFTWFWKTQYHAHRWYVWIHHWKVTCAYDDLWNPVRYIGRRDLNG